MDQYSNKDEKNLNTVFLTTKQMKISFSKDTMNKYNYASTIIIEPQFFSSQNHIPLYVAPHLHAAD